MARSSSQNTLLSKKGSRDNILQSCQSNERLHDRSRSASGGDLLEATTTTDDEEDASEARSRRVRRPLRRKASKENMLDAEPVGSVTAAVKYDRQESSSSVASSSTRDDEDEDDEDEDNEDEVASLAVTPVPSADHLSPEPSVAAPAEDEAPAHEHDEEAESSDESQKEEEDEDDEDKTLDFSGDEKEPAVPLSDNEIDDTAKGKTAVRQDKEIDSTSEEEMSEGETKCDVEEAAKTDIPEGEAKELKSESEFEKSERSESEDEEEDEEDNEEDNEEEAEVDEEEEVVELKSEEPGDEVQLQVQKQEASSTEDEAEAKTTCKDVDADDTQHNVELERVKEAEVDDTLDKGDLERLHDKEKTPERTKGKESEEEGSESAACASTATRCRPISSSEARSCGATSRVLGPGVPCATTSGIVGSATIGNVREGAVNRCARFNSTRRKHIYLFERGRQRQHSSFQQYKKRHPSLRFQRSQKCTHRSKFMPTQEKTQAPATPVKPVVQTPTTYPAAQERPLHVAPTPPKPPIKTPSVPAAQDKAQTQPTPPRTLPLPTPAQRPTSLDIGKDSATKAPAPDSFLQSYRRSRELSKSDSSGHVKSPSVLAAQRTILSGDVKQVTPAPVEKKPAEVPKAPSFAAPAKPPSEPSLPKTKFQSSTEQTRTVFGIPPPGRRSVAPAKPAETKKIEQEARTQPAPSRHNDQGKNSRKPVTKFIGSCKDIDSLLKYGSDEEPETFEQFEDQFEKGAVKKPSLPTQSKKLSPGDRVKHFIGKFQDIDDMLGAAAVPVFPLSPSDRSPFERSFADSWPKKTQQDDSDSSGDSSLEEVKVSSVKVHESKQAIRPRLDAYTEEIDSSAVRIREPKVMQGRITKRPTKKDLFPGLCGHVPKSRIVSTETLEIVWRVRVSEKNGTCGALRTLAALTTQRSASGNACERRQWRRSVLRASSHGLRSAERGPATMQPLPAAQAEMPSRAPYAGRLEIMNSDGEGPSSFGAWDTKLSRLARFLHLLRGSS
ncbi:hypothetical protein MTO96_016695 [Rhipicephalus appendiculatus]